MRRSVLAATIASTALILAGLRGCGSTDAHDPTAAPHTTPSTPAASRGPSPHTQRFGIPLGWSHDAAGARAAAISAVALTGDVARAGFITRTDMITTLASDRFGPTLTRDSAAQLADLLGDAAADGVTVESLLFEEFPLTARVAHADEATARIEVWSVLIAGAPGGGAARQAWRTVTVEVVWERGDWRVDGWTASPGPTPLLAADVPIAAAADIERVTSWPAAGSH